MRAGWNLVVSGATSAGKTTLLNALSHAIPHAERIVTIEETAELRLAQPHVVRLEARPANAEGVGAVSVRELVRAALRMRPDRIVVGEVRGGEALDMLQALNTGHDGSMSTIHANGTADALARLETLVLLADSGLPLAAVRAQMASCIDAVVFVARRPHGVRRVESIGEVDGRLAGAGAGVVRTSQRGAGTRGAPDAPRPTAGGVGTDRPGRGGGAVLTLVLAVVGPIACTRLVARRQPCRGRRSGAGPRHPVTLADPGAVARSTVPRPARCRRAVEPEQAVEHWAIGVAAVGLLAAAFAPTLAMPAALAVALAGPVALRAARSRRERRFATELPAALEEVAAELRGGGTVAAAVERLAYGGGAVGRDLHRVHVRTQLGLALEDALAGWPQEHDAPGVRAAAGALSVAAAMGGKAADAIDGLARSLRYRLDAMAEARALSAQARLSALVVGAAPLGYLAFSALVDPAAVTALVDTGVGRVCLVLGLGLEVLAGLWIRRILGSAG